MTVSILLAPWLCVFSGCARPNQANILLRKENQALTGQVTQLRKQSEMDREMIAGLQARPTTIPSLPPDELDKLVTTHGIQFGRLTGGYNLDNQTSDAGLKIFAVPVDGSNQVFKAAGSFVIEAFDLAAKDPRIGHWDFNLDQSRQAWHGYFLWDYYYVLECPWQTKPQHSNLTIKLTFLDELTKIPFTTERQVTVNPPPATQPQ